MKKFLTILLVLVTLLSFSACSNTTDEKTIVVGASSAPHAEILRQCEDYIESKGYKLKIVECSDYITPNIALEDKTLDANYFQHEPYLTSFCSDHKYTDLVVVAKVHFEPLGIYLGDKGNDFNSLKKGDQIAVPDDTTNCARALQLLAAYNIIEITNDKGLETTVRDIDSKGLEIIQMSAETIAIRLPELAFAVINGNYAVDFKITDKVVAQEDIESVEAKTCVNIVACRKDNENSEKIKVLVEALKQQKVADYINNTYEGRVLPYDEFYNN